MATSIKVTTVDGNENIKARTYSDANPSASNATLNQFARKIGGLSDDTVVNVTRITVDDITSAVAGPLKTFTWTANYFSPETFFKQDFIYPLGSNVDNVQSGVAVTSATVDGANAVFELSNGSTVTVDETNSAVGLDANNNVSVNLTYGDMVTIFNASNSGAKFAEIATSKFAESNYNLLLEYDATNSSIIFKNYVAASLIFAIDSAYQVGNVIGRRLYVEYGGTYPQGVEIMRTGGGMGTSPEYYTYIED